MMWLEICFSRKQVEFPRNYWIIVGGISCTGYWDRGRKFLFSQSRNSPQEVV